MGSNKGVKKNRKDGEMKEKIREILERLFSDGKRCEIEHWAGGREAEIRKIDQALTQILELIKPMTEEELSEALPKKKTHFSYNRIMPCPMPHTGDSTCEGCNMTLEEMEEHNKKCLYKTPEDKIYNRAIDDCLKALKGQIIK